MAFLPAQKGSKIMKSAMVAWNGKKVTPNFSQCNFFGFLWLLQYALAVGVGVLLQSFPFLSDKHQQK